MKKSMTNIIVFFMVGIPLCLIASVIYPVIDEQSTNSEIVAGSSFISEFEAINEYRSLCESSKQSCNRELIHITQQNASRRSGDAQTSSDGIVAFINDLFN